MTPLEKLNLEIRNLAGTFQSATVAMTGAAQTVRAIRDLGERIAFIDPNLKTNAEEVLRAMRLGQATVAPFDQAAQNLLKEFQNGLTNDN